MNKKILYLLLGGCCLLLLPEKSKAQKRVLLDNYFNHEIKQGKTFHYLWSDKANSGFSEWGTIFKEEGAATDVLQQAPDHRSLDKAAVYIIVDPDTKKETPHPNYIEKKAVKTLTKWVKRGGVLVLMANDSGNCEFAHLNDLAEKFDLHFNEVRCSHVTGKNWDMGAVTPTVQPFSSLQKIYMKDAASLTLSGKAKALLVKDGNVLMAVSPKGKGYVVAVGDPWIYNEYIGHKYLPDDFQNHKAAKAFTGYLLKLAE